MPIDSRERSKTEKGVPKRKIIRKGTETRRALNTEEKLFAYFCVPLNVPIPSS